MEWRGNLSFKLTLQKINRPVETGVLKVLLSQQIFVILDLFTI